VRRRLTIAIAVGVVVALVAVAAVVAIRWWQDRDRTDLERATAYAPGDAERLSYTDWAGVRTRSASTSTPRRRPATCSRSSTTGSTAT
jgi:hypothetical protein